MIYIGPKTNENHLLDIIPSQERRARRHRDATITALQRCEHPRDGTAGWTEHHQVGQTESFAIVPQDYEI